MFSFCGAIVPSLVERKKGGVCRGRADGRENTVREEIEKGHGGNSQMLGKNSLMDSWNFRINTFILPSETREWLSW